MCIYSKIFLFLFWSQESFFRSLHSDVCVWFCSNKTLGLIHENRIGMVTLFRLNTEENGLYDFS